MLSRTRVGLVAASLGLAACDPVFHLDVVVAVPPQAQAALGADAYPAQVVLAYGDLAAERVPFFRIGLLCAPGSDTKTFSDEQGGVGCADETRIAAWLMTLDPADVDCAAPIEHGTFVDLGALSEPPWASGVGFAGLHDECGNENDRVALTLAAP